LPKLRNLSTTMLACLSLKLADLNWVECGHPRLGLPPAHGHVGKKCITQQQDMY